MKCKLCPICLTDDYDLIRNCELRGGRFPECSATTLVHVDPYRMPPRAIHEPKQENRS